MSTVGSTTTAMGPRVVNIAVPRVTLQHCIDPVQTQNNNKNSNRGTSGVHEDSEDNSGVQVIGPKLGCPGSSLAVGPLVPIDIVLSRTQVAVRI